MNFTSDDTSSRVRTGAYGSEQWDRLVAIKTKFDPSNIFRHNANIPPA